MKEKNSAAGSTVAAPRTTHAWTFLSNHAHVLIFLNAHSDARLREVAEAVGITERAVQMIVADLEAAGVLQRVRVGRRNSYTVTGDVPLRHPIEEHRTVGDLLETIGRPDEQHEE